MIARISNPGTHFAAGVPLRGGVSSPSSRAAMLAVRRTLTGLGVFNPPNPADFGLDPNGGGMHCSPLDVPCVARQTAAGNALVGALVVAQADNNYDQCVSNAGNAASQGQFDSVMATCDLARAANLGPQAGDLPVSYAPSAPVYAVAPQAAAAAASIVFSVSSGNITAPRVGEGWSISIRGAAPGQPVSVYGNPSASSGVRVETQMGSTDGAGNFSLSGSFSPDQVGSWSEVWKVAGNSVGSWNFAVGPAAAGGVSTGPTPGVSPTVVAPPTTAGGSGAAPAAAAAAALVPGFSLSQSIGPLPAWAWLAGAAALFFMGGRR